MSKKHKSAHKYNRINLGTKDKPRWVYACALLDCSHYQLHARLLVNKLSICWKCLKEFRLDAEVIGRHPRTRPTCLECRGGIVPVEIKKENEKLEDAMEMLLALRGDLE